MKRNIIISLFGGVVLLSACHDLDLNPLANGSTENWYSSEKEIEMAVNDLYRDSFWPLDDEGVASTDWVGECVYRENMTPFMSATLNGQDARVKNLWSNQYKVIARANSVILKYQRALDNGASESIINRLVAEAHFHRACAYSKLASKFGAVPLKMKSI